MEQKCSPKKIKSLTHLEWFWSNLSDFNISDQQIYCDQCVIQQIEINFVRTNIRKLQTQTQNTKFIGFSRINLQFKNYYFLLTLINKNQISKQRYRNIHQMQHIQKGIYSILGEVNHFGINDYCESGSWGNSIVFILALGTVVYILSIITTEYSWIDRIWSLLPILFQGHILLYQQHCDNIPISLRQWVIFALTTLWGARLTYNFWRKGGYKKGGEDYRWVYLRKNYPRFLVEFLNFFFTAYYQVFLIYLFAAPIKYAYTGQWSLWDYVCVGLWLAVWIGEVVADQQQWKFQTKKYELLKTVKLQDLPQPYKCGFIKQGLFSISRHPNFFCEISIWWVVYLFSVSSIGWNYSLVGAVLLNLLFLGSTSLTEKISTEKYPEYQQYQQQVSRLVPYMIIPKKTQKAKEN